MTTKLWANSLSLRPIERDDLNWTGVSTIRGYSNIDPKTYYLEGAEIMPEG
ncbi:hypothetical protein CY34DRAFT_19657 [Suillus luteus UH-Slu-Lm8-n1]|uniref:Uncharacterized protein n=1 Tax=Suillus luteus UH-Slu-Lm8-n1 TaxID=930992 RepID=A0A0C9ZQT9_9AGAM|nr:hypothetical protein CY34DRAFT_19657 [Suillus luteus UH-Slu-Lm8-n1]